MATPVSHRAAGLVALLVLSACGGSGNAGGTLARLQPQGSGVAVTVAPSAPLLPAGASVQLTAAVTGTSDVRVSWSVGQGAGTVTAAGVYTAPEQPGTYQVTATSQASPDSTATVIVDVRQRLVGHSVTIEPAVATVNPGNTVGFSALVDGAVDSRVTWSLLSSGGGSISPQGSYTAPSSPGQYTVAAVSDAHPDAVGTAMVTVVPSATVVVSPAEAFVAPGGTLALSGIAVGPLDPRVSWSVDEGAAGGSVDANGVYRAPQAGGPYHVTATSLADGGARATATLQLRSLVIAPASTQAFVGDSITVTASSNDPSVTHVTWGRNGVTFTSLPIGESASFHLPALGEHTVTASAGGVTASATLMALDRPGFHVSGTATGLAASVRLQLRSADVTDSLLLSADGSFSFPSAVRQGIAFWVEVLANGNTQPCTLANGSGLMPGADFSEVRLDCTQPPATMAGYPAIVDASGRPLVAVPLSALGTTYLGLRRVNPGTLTRDSGFAEDVWSAPPLWMSAVAGMNVAQDASGRYLVAGADWVGKHFSVLRLGPDGAVDQTFGANGVATIEWFGLPYSSTGAFMSQAYAVAILPDGRIVAAGGAARAWDGSLAAGVVACFLPDGTLDSSFGDGGTVVLPVPDGVATGAIASMLAVLTDARLAVVQRESDGMRGIPGQVHWLSSSGTLDPAFTRLADSSGKVVMDGVESVLVRGDGSMWLTGRSSSGLVRLAHVLPDGSLTNDSPRAIDSGCGSGAGIPGLLGGASGSFYDWSSCGIRRWNGDGSLDTSFGVSGTMPIVGGHAGAGNFTPTGYWLLPDGAMVASGRDTVGGYLKRLQP